MLPNSGNSSPENKRPKPTERISRTWLIISLLTLQILLLILSRQIHNPHRNQHNQPPLTDLTDYVAVDPTDDPPCEHGKIFVYDLPKQFNSDLLQRCDKLNPWFSRCESLSNRGFGPKSTPSVSLPTNLTGSWFMTDQFALEVIFHNRIMSHECRTHDPLSATAFYVPFYAGLAVGRYLWNNYTSTDRDRDCGLAVDWLVHRQPYYNRSRGWDHFLTMGRITWDFRRSSDDDWGSACLHHHNMKNVTRLLIERNSWDYFDVGVPYPTGFHPRTASDLLTWQDFTRSRNRTTMFSFAGATRGFIKNDFRALLIRQCEGSDGFCKVVDCGGSRCAGNTSVILETFLDSDFCLQPRGDSFTRKSIFDCMVAGSIPVFFWRRTAYYQYEWFLPGDQDSFSVYIDRSEVENGTSIRDVLAKFSREEVRLMREKVIEYIPSIVYAEPNKGLDGVKDAFDIAIEGVLRRMKEQEGGYKW